MVLFKWIYNHSFLGRTVDLISDSIQYNKDRKLISDTFYGPAFKKVIDNYLKRCYCITRVIQYNIRRDPV